MRIAAIDPAYGKPCTIAIVDEDETLVYLAKFKHSFSGLELSALKKQFKFKKLYLESNWYGLNVLTLQRLSEVVGWIRSAAMLNGIEIEMVSPRSWQNKIPGFNNTTGTVRANIIITLARSMARVKGDLDADEAAAIHIGYYAIRKIKAENITGGGKP